MLRDVSLTVEEGELIVIIGGSGCGKSVFLRLLETPDKGKIYIGEEEITAKGADVNKLSQKMGMVYQGFHLFEHLDVMDNLTLAPVTCWDSLRERFFCRKNRKAMRGPAAKNEKQLMVAGFQP